MLLVKIEFSKLFNIQSWNLFKVPFDLLTAGIASKYLSFAPVIFYGRNGSPFPYNHPINEVVGDPISIAKIENPTQEEIDRVHALYIARLRELFDQHKAKFDPLGEDLVIRQ